MLAAISNSLICSLFSKFSILNKFAAAKYCHILLFVLLFETYVKSGIVIEDKSNSEKHASHEFKTNEIFRASDLMVDSLTNLLDRERKKRKSS